MTRIMASAVMLSMISIGGMTSMAQAATVSTPAVTAPTAIAPSPATDTYTNQVLTLINQKRAAVGAPAVKWNQKIGNVSQDWSVHLGTATKSDTFDWSKIHRTDAGGSLIPSGATWYREIVGFNGSAQSVVDWWMNSASHKAAMLDPRATDIGIGYVVPTSGPYAGWHMVVSNLAAYPGSVTVAGGAAQAPVTTAPSVAVAKTMNTIDKSGTLWAYSAPGNGKLGSRVALGAGWGSAKQIISTDWNQDGILDIVARWNNGYVTLYQGINSEDFKAPVNIASGLSAYDLTATKLRNTDKYPGLVARNTVDGKLYYYSNPSGKAVGSKITLGNGGWAVMSEINALDWDGDKKMDLLVRNSAGQLLLYRTNGAGAIVSETRKIVGSGWGSFESVNIAQNFASKGSVGVVAQMKTGALRYYPIASGKFGAYTLIGTSGWSGYNIASGTVEK
jgi:uncharacterized protein YkwD